MTLRDVILNNLSYNNERWDDVVFHTISPEEFKHNSDFSMPNFTLWTKNFVYTVVNDSDCGDYIITLPRNPPE